MAIVAAANGIHQVTSESHGLVLTSSDVQGNALMTRIREADLHPGIVVMPVAVICAHAHTHQSTDEHGRGDAYQEVGLILSSCVFEVGDRRLYTPGYDPR